LTITSKKAIGAFVVGAEPQFKMTRPTDLRDWHFEAIQLMAREGVSLGQAATILGQRITSEEANKVIKKLSFQQMLWEARHSYFAELGDDPKFKKSVVIGKMLALAQKLEESGSFDKASEVLFKIAKMNEWVGAENTVNIFGELTQADMDAIRERITESKPQRIN
jgi:hypothetical protein